MSEPAQKPGRSKQDYSTPPEFLEAVQRRFGAIDLDLACRADNMVAPFGLTEDVDALSKDWTDLHPSWVTARGDVDARNKLDVAFCNPPFAQLAPWAAKCESVALLPRRTLLLVPASMGSKWWARHVLGKGMVFGIPRLQFVGTDSLYPKDLALILYTSGVHGFGYWDWRAEA